MLRSQCLVPLICTQYHIANKVILFAFTKHKNKNTNSFWFFAWEMTITLDDVHAPYTFLFP